LTPRRPPPFPTRRSSDLSVNGSIGIIFNQADGRRQSQHTLDLGLFHSACNQLLARGVGPIGGQLPVAVKTLARGILHRVGVAREDRKSTRLNSSHVKISY